QHCDGDLSHPAPSAARRGGLTLAGMLLHCKIKGAADELFQSAKSRATDRHSGVRPSRWRALKPTHHATQQQHEISAPHGIKLRRVAGEVWHAGAKEAREQHCQRQHERQREDEDAWSFQSHTFSLPLWPCRPPATTRKEAKRQTRRLIKALASA